ncbi:hypothetical protein [Dermatobacter hominis]|uniref:hypothetical protein n=1 Tax=Dermatobacter hominis TaxID=2884263 RepID=UPI001D1238FE|nr:hypothetical protein [Dermatobacter hominis]UDY37858.1 hypothetical protein LH044_10015 [Dermatobacter hominis]
MSVSTLVLLGLAVVWAIVLLPEALKRISKARSGDSIRSFNHHLSSLQRPAAPGGSNVIELRSQRPMGGRPAARPAVGPAPVSPAVRRRRQEVLTVLGSASVLTLLCSVAFGGPFLLLFLLSAALLVTYVVALYQVTNAPATARDPYGMPAAAPVRRSDVHGVRVSPVSARSVAN